jgi:hypothetical protein
MGSLAVGLLVCASAVAQETAESTTTASDLHRNEAMVMLDYQVIRVPGDQSIDFMGLHVHHKVADGVYVAAGAYAPLVKGDYGGFMAFDIGGHLQHRLTSRLFATAGLSGGGGGGGRSVEQSKVLSGTGGFVKGYVGLGYDFGSFSVGANLAKMKFKNSAIDSTQANFFVSIPYTYLTGPFSSHGSPLSADDARQTAEATGESMLSLMLDNYRQINPQGAFKGTLRATDLQYAHFIAPDTYWYAGLGVGYRGLPLYNQLLGGIGQRVKLAPGISLYGQLGIGSGGYAPEKIDTSAGLLVYPRVSAEYALTRNLGLLLSGGYLWAPKGSSKNLTYGLALTHHLNGSGTGGNTSDWSSPASWQGFRVSLFQQTDVNLRYRDIDRDPLRMIGVQVDIPINPHWYLPVQAAVAYSAYLGYPGYGELLAGLGLQSKAGPADRLQFFGELMGGSNVHGLGVKADAGMRYVLNDRISMHLRAGHIETHSSSSQRFSANSVGLGVDYRFSVPVR